MRYFYRSWAASLFSLKEFSQLLQIINLLWILPYNTQIGHVESMLESKVCLLDGWSYILYLVVDVTCDLHYSTMVTRRRVICKQLTRSAKWKNVYCKELYHITSQLPTVLNYITSQLSTKQIALHYPYVQLWKNWDRRPVIYCNVEGGKVMKPLLLYPDQSLCFRSW